MRCLVTGGAGFIGSHIVKRLLEESHEVAVVDNLSTGNIDNLRWSGIDFDQIDKITVTSTDMTDLFKSFRPQWVFHLAALPRVQFSIANPIMTNDANISGTLNILEQSRILGVERFVYSSSSSVYGSQDILPLTEDMCPNPLSPYALQKLTGEQYTIMYNEIHGLPTIALRYFNVYGERQSPNGSYAAAIPKFALKALENEKIQVYGDGEQTRDFTHVSDVINANIFSAKSDNKKAFGQVFNVGCCNQTSVNQIVEYIKTVLNNDVKVQHIDPVVESRHTRADITKAKDILGWSPEISFKEGIIKTLEGIKRRYQDEQTEAN